MPTDEPADRRDSAASTHHHSTRAAQHRPGSSASRVAFARAPSLGPARARLRLRGRLRADGRADTEWLGCDSDHPEVERWARQAVSVTYLHPLRDAASNLRPGRDNPLVTLLSALAPEGHDDRARIESMPRRPTGRSTRSRRYGRPRTACSIGWPAHGTREHGSANRTRHSQQRDGWGPFGAAKRRRRRATGSGTPTNTR